MTVSMPVAPDYLADYRTLGCVPGCTPAELERAWRTALSRSHPDRADPLLHADAAAQTQSLNTAYRRLREFSQRHGRLPGASVSPGAPPAAGKSADEHAPARAPNTRPRGRRRLAFAAVIAVLGASWAMQPDPEQRAPEDAPALASAATEPSAVATLGLDSHADEVLALAGEPMLRRTAGTGIEVWEYGPSMVTLRAHRVTDWYSSPMRPLPVAAERPPDAPALTAPPYRR
jgi:hypothetical protein